MAEQNLNILVRVEGAKAASASIEGISKSTEGVGKSTEATSKKTSALRKTLVGLGGGFAIYKGAQWIKNAVTQTNDLARSTYGLQKITGMDAQTAAGWLALAKARGIQSKQLNMGFITLARQTQGLAKGTKSSVEAFKQLGISAHQWAGMNTEQRMLALADAFQHMKDPAERAALAQKLFGRQAQIMIPLLSKGRDAVQAQITAMGKASGVTNNSVKEQMKLVVAQREMNVAMLQLKGAIAMALAPILIQLAKLLLPITTGFAKLMSHSGAFRIVIIALTAALVVFVATMWLATTAGIAFLGAVAPWLAIIVGIGVAFVLLYQKVKVFRDIVNAVFSWIKAHWILLVAIFAAPIFPFVMLIKHFGMFRNAAITAFNWIKGHWPLLVSILTGPIGAAVIQIVKNWRSIENVAKSVFNTLTTLVHGVAGTIAGVLGGAFKFVKEAVEALIGVLGKAVGLVEKVVGGAKGLAHKATFGLIPGIQTGGYAYPEGGMTALVGERGPEMVHLPQGARVSPLVQSYRGGGGHTVVQVPVYLDRRQIALAMGSFVADQQAAR